MTCLSACLPTRIEKWMRMGFKRKDMEIMAPVGSYESLRAAIDAGTDSVYFGVGQLNMRSHSAVNFTLDDLARVVSIARSHNVKTYLAINTLLYDADLHTMRETMDRAKTDGVSAVIVSDQAGILYARSIDLEVHISTQLNLSNLESVAFYAQFADVMVLARELTLPQVRAIYDGIRDRDIRGPSGNLVRIEMFAHGALCMAISGKCYLSLHETGCSANRGACRQLCRRSYKVCDRDSGTELVLDNHYIMSPKDLCTIDFLDKLFEAGVRVLKIEGRARSAEYVKRVVESYNEALCMIESGNYSPARSAELKEHLATVFNRGFWSGYYMGARIDEWSSVYGSAATKRKVYVGKVTNYFKRIGVAEVHVEAAPLRVGDETFLVGKTTGVLEFLTEEIRVNEKPTQQAPQGVLCSIKVPALIHRGDKLYKFVDSDGNGQ